MLGLLRCLFCHSVVSIFVTPWTVACQAPLSTGFSRQEYWSGLPFPSPGELPDPGIKPGFPALQADSLPSEPSGKPLDVCKIILKGNIKTQGGHIQRIPIGVSIFHSLWAS